MATGTLGALASAWAAQHAWFRADPEGFSVGSSVWGDATVPLAGALAWLSLATWGVILVTRGRVRQLTAGVGLLVAVWLAGVVLHARFTGSGQLAGALRDLGAVPAIEATGWPWLGLFGSALVVSASLAALRWASDWPVLSRKYDAAGASREPDPSEAAEPTNLDLWRAIDEGRDPTEGRT